LKALLSRVASPAGFGLTLVLFFLLPFLSVSCDVPDVGRSGLDYTGTHLVTGAKPDWVSTPEVDDLLGPPNPNDVPDAGVEVLAVILVVLAAAGLVAGLLPRVRARMYGSAALAAATLAAAVVTLVVARSNLRSALLPQARQIAADSPRERLDPDSLVAQALHVELGFWLVVGVLALVLLFNAGTVFLSRRGAAR
jgi:hypothetical protein